MLDIHKFCNLLFPGRKGNKNLVFILHSSLELFLEEKVRICTMLQVLGFDLDVTILWHIELPFILK